MTTLDDVKAQHVYLTAKALGLVEKKGADYNRKQQNDGDTLFNLTVAKQLGIVDTTCQSILVRISDKMMRLVSLTSNPSVEPKVQDEKITDTIVDTINYLIYLSLMYSKERSLLLKEESK